MTDFWRFFCICAVAGLSPISAQAQSLEGLTWKQQKCVLYERAVGDAFDILGHDGFTQGFLDANGAFIESGCVTQGAVCPATDIEYDFANLLTIMTMNEGMASTFVPFGCRDKIDGE